MARRTRTGRGGARTVRANALLAAALLSAALLVVPSTPARAGTTFSLDGQARQRYIRLTSFPLDASGTSHGQPYRDTLRLFVESQMSFSRSFWLRTNLQLLDGQILGPEGTVDGGRAGAQWRNHEVLDHFFLRESVIQVPIGIGVVRAGRMPVHWGLGMIVNDGQTEDSWFADARGGDIVNGVVVDVQPLFAFTQGRAGQAMHLTLAVDVVERDELAVRDRGDLAWRVSGSLTWEEPTLKAGFYMHMRDTTRDGGDRETNIVFDLAGDWHARVAPRLGLRLAGELAAVVGTTRTTPPGGARVKSDLQQLGGVLRADLSDAAHNLDYGLELGFASGDDEPFDGHDQELRFDPSYKVGMILFEEVLARSSARRWDVLVAGNQATLPTQRPGVLPTDGAVANAVYIAPRVRLTLCEGCFRAEAGGLVAFAAEPIVDPAAKAAPDGGEDLNAWGGAAETGPLGYEVNAAASFAFDLEDTVRFSVGTQYGVFLPGEALKTTVDDASVGTIHKWRILADVDW